MRGVMRSVTRSSTTPPAGLRGPACAPVGAASRSRARGSPRPAPPVLPVPTRSMPRPRRATFGLPLLVGVAAAAAGAQPPDDAGRSAAIRDVEYEVTFDSAAARARSLLVAMSFAPADTGPVLLSLPAWTPGAYEIANFARRVTDFGATAGGRALAWDRADHDTWRVRPAGRRGRVTVTFRFGADTLDAAAAWARPDFAFFNGTNVFLYPEGRALDFPATVTVRTEAGWRVATGMAPAGAPGRYREGSYHDLVDMPFFVGRFDLDSMPVAGRLTRLATYPPGAVAGGRRAALWRVHQRAVPPMAAVFGDLPYRTYTTLAVVAPGQGSALEHQNSHLGLYDPALVAGGDLLPMITAHEIFHLWNVKRLRPAELVPYRYDRPQPTTLLWVSEGVTGYYAYLALVRGGVVDSAGFLGFVQRDLEQTAALPPVALEDASLATWIAPPDGSGYAYYPKGALAGLLLDVLIRDASDNRRALDDVMRELYGATYRRGRGFTNAEWWAAAARAAGRPLTDVYARYVDGRAPFPWDTVLPLAGLRLLTDTSAVPRLGVNTARDTAGVRVQGVVPGGAADQAGVRAGDYLQAVGAVAVPRDPTAPDWTGEFRTRYAGRGGAALPIVVRRGGEAVTLSGRVVVVPEVQHRLAADPRATAKAARIRAGILRGHTDR